VVSTTREALAYEYLSSSERGAIEGVYAAREVCVARAHAEEKR
jgi:hypothetical protein